MDRRLLEITVNVPASVANLGAGYDCLALAVELRNRFRLYCDLRDTSPGEKEYEFQFSGRYKDADKRMLTPDGNLFVQAFKVVRKYLCDLAGHMVPRCPVLLEQDVVVAPMRGLGSSSTASVAGTLAAIKFIEAVYPYLRPDDLLTNAPGCENSELNDIIASLAMAVDCCPDNVCASLSGGLTYSFCEADGKVLWGHSRLLHYFHEEVNDPDLRCVALVPSVALETPAARRELENRAYTIHDVAFNISRATCLPAVFRLKRYSLLAAVTDDRVHQMQRARALFVNGRQPIDVEYIFHAALEAGAYAAFIGGAGSALVALAHVSNADAVAERFQRAFDEVAFDPWSVESLLTLEITNQGAVCEKHDGVVEAEPAVKAWFDRVGPRWFPLTAGLKKESHPSPHTTEVPRLSPEPQAVVMLRQMSRVSLAECAVVGDYVRYDEQVRNTLRDWRNRIESPLVSDSPCSANFMIWAAPGSGKSFLIQEIAKANEGRVQYAELNLAKLGRVMWEEKFAEMRTWSTPTLCLLDEIDARADEDWPYDVCLADLELRQSRKDGRAIVFVLVGSHRAGLAGMLEAIRKRYKGPDLVDRVPIGNRFELPTLTLEDRAVAFVCELASAGREQGHHVRQVERLALYYALTNPAMSTLRQLRELAVAATKRMTDSDGRFKYYDLFERGDSQERRVWEEKRQVAEELCNKFVIIQE